ncbi:hypothetical protein KKC94_00405 [Patescibacteria group bacterium]|nr:hypothetical protein [Patescibacteria group bacterium]
MKKNNFFILTSLGLLLLPIASCKKPVIEEPTIQESEPLSAVDAEIPDIFEGLSDEEIDTYYEDKSKEQEELFSNAVIHYDESMCDQLEGETMQTFCLRNVITTKAIAMNDINICNEHKSESDAEDCEELYSQAHETPPEVEDISTKEEVIF